MAVAVHRALVQRLGHLRVARGARIAAVLVKRQAGLVEVLADERQHRAHAGFLVGDDVLVADRQIAQRHLAAVMLHQVHHPHVVPSPPSPGRRRRRSRG